MTDPKKIASPPDSGDELTADLTFLEVLRWGRKEFSSRICQDCKVQTEEVLATLRLDATYQFSEFYYLLHAHRIETEGDLKQLAELHNKYIVGLTKDAGK